jgi:site-specific recombinase
VIGLHFLVLFLTGEPILSAEKAAAALHSVSLLGPSFFFAGLTGVLLWASSLIGAWADNWIAWHRLGEALTSDRRLMRMFGPSRTARFARFLQQNVAGFGSNISLGVMLGLLPEIAKFAGLPLDVRHVTLSSGFAAAAVATLGLGVMVTWPFWLAVMGILSIGVINVTVSFALAMFVAIRARGIQSPERRIIYQALLLRLRQQPLSFIFPTRSAAENSSSPITKSNAEAKPKVITAPKLETADGADPNLG